MKALFINLLSVFVLFSSLDAQAIIRNLNYEDWFYGGSSCQIASNSAGQYVGCYIQGPGNNAGGTGYALVWGPTCTVSHSGTLQCPPQNQSIDESACSICGNVAYDRFIRFGNSYP
ncbi:MAG: hypothetical protein KDD25_01255 [Bdellovibrionales bacterium]|nr:hypothetical protein [Bdellovibrionales bacterium]